MATLKNLGNSHYEYTTKSGKTVIIYKVKFSSTYKTYTKWALDNEFNTFDTRKECIKEANAYN